MGGGATDRSYRIAVDSDGQALITGYTASANLPTTADAHDSDLTGASDAYLAMLDATGANLVYCSYLGGDQSETARGALIDGAGNIYLTGNSNSSDFDTTPGAYAESPIGDYDAFIVKFSPVAAVYKISGTVFEDVDFTGVASDWDGGVLDQALPGVDVELYNASDAYLASTTSDGSGAFSFTDLANGSYKVRVRSATLGDPDTPPSGGFNITVPGTWPYPLAEMTWGHGAAMIGGQDPDLDDTATADDDGPGDTYVVVLVDGVDVIGVNLGFSYELIVTEEDDGKADQVRSAQGSLRQFIKNANAISGINTSYFAITAP
jgi:hypothetical protein